MKPIYYSFILLLTITFFTGCSPKYTSFDNISKGNLQEVEWNDIDGFEEDDLEHAFMVFKKGCEKAKRKTLLKEVCSQSENYDSAIDFFQSNFTPFKLFDDKDSDEGLITGYYEPLLQGSRTKTERFKYPIYKEPKDLVTVRLDSIYPELKRYRLRGKIVNNQLVPYETRGEIKENEHFEAICYVDDKVDLFFLHIQGSGKVQLDSGEIINVGYANQNGREYNSVGKYMIRNGLLKQYGGSMQAMKRWFDDHPSETDKVLNVNESYVFFHESAKSATGSLGVPLVAQRNLAVDRKYIPLGLPVFIQTRNPLTKKDISQLMVAADTGGAIKGKIRADFFWGHGKEAEATAGRMKEIGKLFVLMPN